jgi:transcriptional regulator GlxA family with amidase domain
MRLLLFLMRTQGDIMSASLHAARQRDLERVLPALEFLRRHLPEPLDVEKLARLCHLSAPQFRRVFRAALGATPSEYSRRLRMEEAALLLRRTDDTIDTIASRVGYSDPSFFAHSFKAAMGASPGKYRAIAPV